MIATRMKCRTGERPLKLQLQAARSIKAGALQIRPPYCSHLKLLRFSRLPVGKKIVLSNPQAMQSPTRKLPNTSPTNFRSPARKSAFPSPPTSPTPSSSRKRRNTGEIISLGPAFPSPLRVAFERIDWKSETYSTIVNFFHKQIPEIIVEDKGKPSVREPAAFDLHLDGTLTLKNVKRSSLMVPDLLVIAMDSLERLESEGGLPPEQSGLSYASLLTEILPPPSISAQADLANYYATQIAPHCALISATLLCRLKTWTAAKLLEYSRDASGQVHSRADGFLRLRLGALSDSGLTKEMQGTLKGIDRTFPRLATWLFKRMGSGTKEERIMKQILRFSDAVEFPWTSCNGEKCNHLSSSGSAHVTGAAVGRDAALPTIRLDEVCWLEDGQDEHPHASDVKYAKYILQQAWAQSVANDTTYLVIKSPNYEILGHRDRENQALLLSDLIHVPTFNDGYLQLQIGLYMSIIEDAISRHQQGKRAPTPKVKYDVPAVRAIKVKKPKSVQELANNWTIVKGALSGYLRLAFHVRVSPSPKPDFPKWLLQTTYHRASEPVNSKNDTLHLALEFRPDSNICAGHISAGCVSIDSLVACKIARGREEAERLTLEYQAYQTLSGRGIPCLGVYGLFHSKDGNAVMLFEHVKQVANVQDYRVKYVQLLDQIHERGLVLGRLTSNSLLCTDYGYACFASLAHLRKANNPQEQEDEREALNTLFDRPSQRPRVSHGVSIGPFIGHHEIEGPKAKFDLLVKTMSIDSPTPIRISESEVPDTIDVEFGDRESRDKFFERWCSASKPTGLGKIGCTIRV